MSQRLGQHQKQTQTLEQIQSLSAMQVLAGKLTELPIGGLLERVRNELNENPYLESAGGESAEVGLLPQGSGDATPAESYDPKKDFASEDDIPGYLWSATEGEPKENSIDYGDSQSFYEQLMDQAGEYRLTSHERQILEYLIGNLDDNGFLSQPLFVIVDELQISHECDTTEEEVERILRILWQFEPAGLGARSLQESLLIQCAKREGGDGSFSLLKRIIEKDWESISHNRWDIISQKYELSEQKVELLRQDLRRFNPRPGSALGEKATVADTHIIPDVVIDVDMEGNIELTLNDGDVPTLTVSEDAYELIDQEFVRDYVNRGSMFIKALEQRRRTILNTMQAIVKLQKQYFLSGDEETLRPMQLEDVAKLTKQDPSTVSRVCNSKFVETPYGTHPLNFYFLRATSIGGEETSVRHLQQIIKEIVDGEDKTAPLTDDALVEILAQKGYNVARRTVVKYRNNLGIPTSRMRRGR